MSRDPNVSTPAPESSPFSAIENELPAYRAISPHAVLSLIFGVLAALSFAHLAFLSCAAIAVLLGLYAQGAIRRYSDVLTGAGLAQAGIALGVVCGLASVTTSTVQDYLRKYEASRFARHYAKVLESGQLANAVWYVVNPDAREGKSPQEVYKDLETHSRDAMAFQMQTGGVQEIIKRINSAKGHTVHFSKLEKIQLDGLDVRATALLDIDGPTSKDYPAPEEFAVLDMRGVSRKGKMEWWFHNVVYPYKPGTFMIAPKPTDDGHGHAH